MSRIVLTTSSSGIDSLDIPTNIKQIRLRIFVNNVEFSDGENIDLRRLQGLMHGGAIAPVYTTPLPSSEVTALLMKLKNDGIKDIFIVSVSSALSESYNIIKAAAEPFKNDLNIYIYNCNQLNFCEAALALEAEHLLQAGSSMPVIAKRLDDLRQSHEFLYAIEDLSHLVKNKKLSATSGFFANIFNIKPILTVTPEGVLVPTKKIRRYQNALNYIIDEFADVARRGDSFVYIQSAGISKFDNYVAAKLKERANIKHIPIIPLSSISIANSGPTGIAVGAFIGKVPHIAKHFEN